MVGRELETGPTARTVAQNVKRLRQKRGMNYTELSERLQLVAGWTVNAVGIRRIEDGERRVTPDDLVALALTLGVAPPSLLMPATDASENALEADAIIEATGFSEPVAAQVFWEWLVASEPLDEDPVWFRALSWPIWMQRNWEERIREARRQMLNDMYGKLPESDIPESLQREMPDGDH